MNLSLPGLIVALPFASALLLASIPSWRFGTWVNAAAATLLFLLTCLLPWYPRVQSPLLRTGTLETHLVLLTSFIAMTTSWHSVRLIDRLRARVYSVAYQALVGALICALLSDNLALTWFMLVAAVAAGAVLTGLPGSMPATVAAWRMLLHCGVGLMLALFGLMLLSLAVEPNSGSLHWSTLQASAFDFHATPLDLGFIFLVLGCGTLVGLMPLHSWLTDAAADGDASGAIILSTLFVTVPLVVILRVREALVTSAGVAGLLLVFGVVSLLLAAFCLSARLDTRRVVAIAGMAQIGMVIFAFGLGSPTAILAGVLQMTLLSLVRASLLQCQSLSPTTASKCTCAVAGTALLVLPLFALFLIASATIEYAPWLMLLVGGGVLLITWELVGQLPALAAPIATSTGSGNVAGTLELIPIWVQLAFALGLAVAMPGPVVEWFHTLARAN
jgi:hydrogenase-4 component F